MLAVVNLFYVKLTFSKHLYFEQLYYIRTVKKTSLFFFIRMSVSANSDFDYDCLIL